MALLVAEPLVDFVARHLGPPKPRAGEGSGRPWWLCPFHPDNNPSMSTIPGGERWKCFGCGAAGDAIDFLRRLIPGMTFRQAQSAVGCKTVGVNRDQSRPAHIPAKRPERPRGWHILAQEIVEKAMKVLWANEGADALAYLVGRGLTEATIRSARLGYWPADDYRQGIYETALVIHRGVTIPWFNHDVVEAVNFRLLGESKPATGVPEGTHDAENPALRIEERDCRYSPAPSGSGTKRYHLLKGSRRSLFPGREAIVVGRPLVIVEGEFDALLLGQELAGLASVVTFGPAGDRPTARVLSAMLAAPSWFLSSDADAAGDQAATRWLDRSDRCIRVAPPAKDWTAAHLAGLDLQEFWHPILKGKEPPGLPGNDRLELACETWKATLSAWPEVWREAWEERAAIMWAEAKLPRAVAEQKAYEDVSKIMKLVGAEDCSAGSPISPS